MGTAGEVREELRPLDESLALSLMSALVMGKAFADG